jgi:hypothetical protein
MHRTLIILTFVSLLTAGANAQRLITGEEMVQPCTQALLGDSADSLDFMPMAFCIGVISGIAWTTPHLKTGSQFCVPPDATRDEQLAKVVQYMEAHTERLQEDFFVLAFQALRQSWPCPKPPLVAAREAKPSTKAMSVTAHSPSSNPGSAQRGEYTGEHLGLPVEKTDSPQTGTTKAHQRIPRGNRGPKKTGARKISRQMTGISPVEMFGILPSSVVWSP